MQKNQLQVVRSVNKVTLGRHVYGIPHVGYGIPYAREQGIIQRNIICDIFKWWAAMQKIKITSKVAIYEMY